ncbi:MAG TPA: hypothetical protein VJX67_11695, partial [Blastocatellia bacterium]|nr:hypothetical protein [Blastocatellia bacterium]
MFEPLRIAVVAEGPTDAVVIEAAISQILGGRNYILTQLQPEQSLAFGPTGTGWGGVFRWCRQSAKRGGKELDSGKAPGGALSGDPLFEFHDVLILHLDADVAGKHYQDANIADGFDDLPCAAPCPPARATTDVLRRVLLKWGGETAIPERTVLCIPSKNTEAWVLAALFPGDEYVVGGNLECLQNPGSRIGRQKKAKRVRKARAA